MPEVVALEPALAACVGLAMPLPAAAVIVGLVAAVGCIDALLGVVVITAELSEGAAAWLQATTLLSSKTHDKRDESEGVSWIIGLLCEPRTVPRPV